MRSSKIAGSLAAVLIASLMFASAQSGTDTKSQTDAKPQSSQPAPNAPKQRPSPPGDATCSFGDGQTIKVAYSRPYMRGRKIMGGLVPYGKVWRTGANEATSFETSSALMVGTREIPAGKYTMYTVPSEGTWTLIINKQTGQWGTQYDQTQDLARVDMKVQPLSSPVDQFTISFDRSGANTCSMKLEWENTSASVDFDRASTTNQMK